MSESVKGELGLPLELVMLYAELSIARENRRLAVVRSLEPLKCLGDPEDEGV
jgi:hypothetical protein